MTKEQKKARRRAKHDMQAKAMKHATRRMGLFSRDAQLKSAAKMLADRFFAYARHAPAEVKDLATNA